MKKDKMTMMISTIIFCGCVVKTIKVLRDRVADNAESNEETVTEE